MRSETQGRGQPLPFTIVVDAGHGGHERAGRSTPYGVRGPGGLLEKDVTLGLAQRVAAQLGSGVVLTRHGDVNPSLAERAAIAQRCGAGVFLSLHANGASGRRRGAEAWVHRRAGAPSRALAAALGRELATLGGPQPGLAQEDLAVLTPERLPRGAAACLLEVDYLSDPDGEARLREPHALDHLAGAIVRAVRRYGEARALDAGTPDAGIGDAGAGDAGAGDAGTPDAGDAGSGPDGGAPACSGVRASPITILNDRCSLTSNNLSYSVPLTNSSLGFSAERGTLFVRCTVRPSNGIFTTPFRGRVDSGTNQVRSITPNEFSAGTPLSVVFCWPNVSVSGPSGLNVHNLTLSIFAAPNDSPRVDVEFSATLE